MTPRERAALPVTGTIGRYVAWLNREVYGGKMTREQKEAAGVSATLYRWFRNAPSVAPPAGSIPKVLATDLWREEEDLTQCLDAPDATRRKDQERPVAPVAGRFHVRNVPHRGTTAPAPRPRGCAACG